MNFKQVLKAYAILRNLTDDESALLETLRGLSESDREQLVESLSPGGAGKKKAATVEKKGQCAACDHVKTHPVHTQSNRVGYHVYQPTRSRRATSLAEQIKSTGKPHLGEGPVCTICSHTEDYEDHSEPSPHYHPFQPPVRNAAGESSTNGAGASTTASTGDEKVSAGAVAGGSSE